MHRFHLKGHLIPDDDAEKTQICRFIKQSLRLSAFLFLGLISFYPNEQRGNWNALISYKQRMRLVLWISTCILISLSFNSFLWKKSAETLLRVTLLRTVLFGGYWCDECNKTSGGLYQRRRALPAEPLRETKKLQANEVDTDKKKKRNVSPCITKDGTHQWESGLWWGGQRSSLPSVGVCFL